MNINLCEGMFFCGKIFVKNLYSTVKAHKLETDNQKKHFLRNLEIKREKF